MIDVVGLRDRTPVDLSTSERLQCQDGIRVGKGDGAILVWMLGTMPRICACLCNVPEVIHRLDMGAHLAAAGVAIS